MRYTLRQSRADDIDWLYELNCASYRDVVVRQFGGWDDAVQRQIFFSRWQGPRAARIIQSGTERIGVLILEQRGDYDWLQEIQISPYLQGQGLGSSLLRELIADARSRGVPVRLQVLHANEGARRLYERLGFVVIQKLDNHHLMEIA
ncbi:GNAT family N-acetyltransferase [Marinobacter sp. BGYM27]|uniref:GNAT family N-acetyltransferase n=1 Tax=Marinobacter sp. BGYM27 TaxID=2975597 RepID=UPI0021A65734|nr:GNAT family N-acetyltransferase [Marinobacter sp. BGYM27]MDG5500237.1 GNAT family N-acetyltransferase [Marinobacter sp. BGYM27]